MFTPVTGTQVSFAGHKLVLVSLGMVKLVHKL